MNKRQMIYRNIYKRTMLNKISDSSIHKYIIKVNMAEYRIRSL